ncbi:amidohydrolase family protein [[Eubacterium] cellulosolvens]
MIIDSHTHIGKFALFNVESSAGSLISVMDEWKISTSITFSLPNRLTLEGVRKFPDRFAGLVWINPHKGQKAIEEIDLAIIEWGFKGIKMHPLIDSYLVDQEIVYPIMDIAKKHRVPVLFHCGHPPWSLPWHFANLADVYPDVTIIMAHMGHGHIVYINGAIDVASAHDNIILETSGMPMHSKIKEAAERVGVNRVIFGSDSPFGHPSFEIQKVKVSGLRPDQVDLVLGENAKKIFKL